MTNKAGTDGSGSGYYSSIKFSIANGATSTGYFTYHRTGDNAGDFTFKSRNTSTTYPELMRIRSNGNIGITNSAPLYPLHFKNSMGSSPAWIHMEVTGTNTVGGGGGIAFDTSASNNASNNGLFLATVSGERSSSDNGSNSLVFKTSKNAANGDDGNASTPKTAMTINENQVVSIPSLNNSRGLQLNPGSNAGSLVFDRNGSITSFIRASDGGSNVAGGSGGGSRIRLGKTQIHFDTFPYVTNVGDAVTYTPRMHITSNGYVNMPDQPAFKASGNLTFADWNSYEHIIWGTENFDNSSSWDGTKFTCPTGGAGDYLFQVELLSPAAADNGNNNYILFALFIGTAGQNLWRQDWGSATNYNASFSGMVLQLSDGDEVRVALHKSYGRPYASGYNSFSGCKLN